MADARELIAETRAQLKAVEDKLFAHPYLSAVEEGRISKEKLRLFAGEQYHIVNSDLRSVALLVSRQGHGPNRDFFLGALQVGVDDVVLLAGEEAELFPVDPPLLDG